MEHLIVEMFVAKWVLEGSGLGSEAGFEVVTFVDGNYFVGPVAELLAEPVADAGLADAEPADAGPADAELADAELADAELADAEPADAALVASLSHDYRLLLLLLLLGLIWFGSV